MMRPDRLLPALSTPGRPPRRGGRFAVGAGVSLLLHLGAALAFVGTWSPARPPEVGGQAVTVTLVQGPLARGGVPAQASPAADTGGQEVAPARTVEENLQAMRSEGAEAISVPAGPAEEPARGQPRAATSPAPGSARGAARPSKAVTPSAERPTASALEPAAVAAGAELRPTAPTPPPPDRKPAIAEAPSDPAGVPPPRPPRPRPATTDLATTHPRADADTDTSSREDTARQPSAAPARRTPRARQLAGLTGGHDGGRGDVGGEGEAPVTDGAPGTADVAKAAAGQGAAGAAPRAGNPAPEYPARARRRGWEGRVLLEVAVDAEGRVAAVRTVESSGYDLLDRAAAAAVQRWRFAPARRFGREVADTVEIPIRFALKDG